MQAISIAYQQMNKKLSAAKQTLQRVTIGFAKHTNYGDIHIDTWHHKMCTFHPHIHVLWEWDNGTLYVCNGV